MHCNYCRSWNADEEHRCSRCGRRLAIVSTATPNYPTSRAAPALAHADVSGAVLPAEKPAALPKPARNPQKLSFGKPSPSNVIPFESFAGERIQPPTQSRVRDPRQALPPVAGALRTPARNLTRRRPVAPKLDSPQAGLDFLTPAPSGPRTLKTKVEAVIYCDADVATPRHRIIAAVLDCGVIFCGFAVFFFTFYLMGGMFRLNRQTSPFLIGVFGTLAMFYGLLWIWAGRETMGMRWTGLRLIDFDGFPASRRSRILRVLGACLGSCAGGIGLLWALVDEEKLAWHDHMSKTFPTFQESNSSFFRKR